ncbi:hypothetical protein [Frankia tisae]|nr:hypothetical protein [Frankia tisae]
MQQSGHAHSLLAGGGHGCAAQAAAAQAAAAQAAAAQAFPPPPRNPTA